MNIKHFFLVCASFALLSSCGQQSDAEQLVEQFITDYAVDPTQIDVIEFNKLDSTKNINDSIVNAMQSKTDELFKNDIDYSVKQSGRMLYFIRMHYAYKGDTLSKTFYIDESMQHIVSFK
ncbi:hypothetical protein [Prevotella sp. E13-27]|jgi:hypothetical protein|uniref:hypothetical protein n=1 Tax=Prevotella sp. E13-27 TaxID=2938122 RepID=UPI00200B6F2E|nr:hypothetical protein [Prevotella sp. E13-27]MCK8623157.1 hypothetical protein [Prevotella sp. E13-27]